MPDAKSPLANQGVKELMMQALESERGIKVRLKTNAAAHVMRRKMNTVRVADRRKSEAMYAFDHPLHGSSDFDTLEFAIEGDSVIIRRTDVLVAEEVSLL